MAWELAGTAAPVQRYRKCGDGGTEDDKGHADVVWARIVKSRFRCPPPQWGGLDLDSRSSGCARLGGGVVFISPNDTQAKYTEQSATNVPLWSTGTRCAPCRKQQAGRE